MNDKKLLNLEDLIQAYAYLPQLVCILDENLNIVAANEPFCYSFSVTLEKIMNKHFSEIFDTFGFINYVNEFSTSPELEACIKQNFSIDEKLKHFRLHVFKVNQENKLIIITGEDQTHYYEKLQEFENYKQSTNLVAKKAMIGEYSLSFIQEILSPLANILKSINFIQKSIQSNELSSQSLNEQLNKISQSSLRVHTVVQRIEMMGKNESTEAVQHVLVSEILNNNIYLCAESFKHFEIKVVIDKLDPLLKIECKFNLISQVLLNLIRNAIEAVANKEEKWIKITVSENKENVRFKIMDSGDGIPSENKDKIFKQFFTTKPESNGLGLSVSKEIVEKHFGTLFLDPSESNTCFVFDIPKGLTDI